MTPRTPAAPSAADAAAADETQGATDRNRVVNDTDQTEARPAPKHVTTGPPEPATAGRPVQSPPETEAQMAAGPHRPEPAQPIRHDPIAVGPAARPRDRERAGPPIKVRATQDGFYDDSRQRAGTVFAIRSMADYSDKWMEKVPASTPEQTVTGQQRIQQEHDAINASRAGGRSRPATGNKSVLDADDDEK